VNALRGFGRFWYDFVVGDDWKIAAAVAAALVVAAVVVAATGADAIFVAGVILAAFVLAFVLDVSR
jgi:hypothetical protein